MRHSTCRTLRCTSSQVASIWNVRISKKTSYGTKKRGRGCQPDVANVCEEETPMTASAVRAMFRSHPAQPAHGDVISRCVDACFNCVETCTACADACLS